MFISFSTIYHLNFLKEAVKTPNNESSIKASVLPAGINLAEDIDLDTSRPSSSISSLMSISSSPQVSCSILENLSLNMLC